MSITEIQTCFRALQSILAASRINISSTRAYASLQSSPVIVLQTAKYTEIYIVRIRNCVGCVRVGCCWFVALILLALMLGKIVVMWYTLPHRMKNIFGHKRARERSEVGVVYFRNRSASSIPPL